MSRVQKEKKGKRLRPIAEGGKKEGGKFLSLVPNKKKKKRESGGKKKEERPHRPKKKGTLDLSPPHPLKKKKKREESERCSGEERKIPWTIFSWGEAGREEKIRLEVQKRGKNRGQSRNAAHRRKELGEGIGHRRTSGKGITQSLSPADRSGSGGRRNRSALTPKVRGILLSCPSTGHRGKRGGKRNSPEQTKKGLAIPFRFPSIGEEGRGRRGK